MFQKFFPLTKVEEQSNGTLKIYGLVTAEQPDRDKEVCLYDKTKPFYVAKVEEMKKATAVPGMEQSIMPLREMHQLKAIGKGLSIDFDDEAKTIKMAFEVVDDDAIKKVKKGVLPAFSQGGDYVGPKVASKAFPGCKEYVANPGEVSLVDAGSLSTALIEAMKGKQYEYAKADGSTELRKYALPLKVEADERLMKVNGYTMEACSKEESTFELNGEYYKEALVTESVDQKIDRLEALLKAALSKAVVPTQEVKPDPPVKTLEEVAAEKAAAVGGGKEEKAMTAEELKKAASAHLKKAMEMVKGHVVHMGAVHKAHHDNVASLNAAHEGAMEASPNVAACKALTKAHMSHMGGVHKAHMDHAVALHKAFGDGLAAHMDKADSPPTDTILDAAVQGGEPTSINPEAGAPHSTKGLTADDLQKKLDAFIAEVKAAATAPPAPKVEAAKTVSAEDLQKALTEQEDKFFDLLTKALIGMAGAEVELVAAPGIGDRALVVKRAQSVQQTQPVVTKAEDMHNTGGAPPAIEGVVVTKDDVIAAGNGNQDALLKMARSIKVNPSGVPQSLQSTKLGART